MITEVYEAFKDANVEDQKAIAAASAIPNVEHLATKEDILKLEITLTVRFGSMLAIAVGVIIAVLKFL